MKRAKKRVSTDARNTEVTAFSHLSRLEHLFRNREQFFSPQKNCLFAHTYVNAAIAQDKRSGLRKGGLDFRGEERLVYDGKANKPTTRFYGSRYVIISQFHKLNCK